jgi:hypothetical protein
MVNRVFIVRPDTEGAVSLLAACARTVPPASMLKRRTSGHAATVRDPVALRILRHNGWAKNRTEAKDTDGLRLLPDNQDITVRRIPNIDPTWAMLVINDDLHTLSASKATAIIDALDINAYTALLAETYTKNWTNSP